MTAWQAVLAALGGNATLLAALAYLSKGIVTQWLNKDLEQLKQQYQAELESLKSLLQREASRELESLKSQLAVAAAQDSVLLSRLQDRRAEVIGDVYGKIATAIRHMESPVKPLQFSWEDPQEKKAQVAVSAIIAAQERFDETRIWLTESCANSIEELFAHLRSNYNDFASWLSREDRQLPDAAKGRRERAWMDAWNAVSETKVPAARRALEKEMRSLLSPPSVPPDPPETRWRNLPEPCDIARQGTALVRS